MSQLQKKWNAWLLFVGVLIIIFVIVILVITLVKNNDGDSSDLDQQSDLSESANAQNDIFRTSYPHEFESWSMNEETSFVPMHRVEGLLDERPQLVVLWAQYAFDSRQNSLNKKAEDEEDVDIDNIHGAGYNGELSEVGTEIVSAIGCADCHEPETMKLRAAQPALREAWQRKGKDLSTASQQEMRSLVCGQCHTEYYFSIGEDPENSENESYLLFPQENELTCEAAEAYYDSIGYYDFIHPLSQTPIIRAQHPGFEIASQGIHARRDVACADCHMPKVKSGNTTYTDHHIISPLADMNRTCKNCHDEAPEVLIADVKANQEKCLEVRNRAEQELAKAHFEAKFIIDNGASSEQMKPIQDLLRRSQWRWDYATASQGATFHAPQEVTRLLTHSLDYAQQARLKIAVIAARQGFSNIPVPDFSTKEKALQAVGIEEPKPMKINQES